jgi:hypothetical protein
MIAVAKLPQNPPDIVLPPAAAHMTEQLDGHCGQFV